MRREGFELEVSKPEVIIREIDGVKCEPFEDVQVDVPEEYVGSVIEALGNREGIMENMTNYDNQVRLNYVVPSRGLIGFMTEFMTMTKGYGIINHTYKEYRKMAGTGVGQRKLGVLVSMENGKATAYALGQLEDRGVMFIEPGAEVYEGMIVGENNHDNDLAVNVVKGKKLTNTRASGSDHTVVLKRPRLLSLETCLDYINNDNYLSYQEKVDEVINKYNGLNIDDRDDVTNYNVISQYQEKIKEIEDSNKVEPVEVITYDFDSLDEGTYTENIVTDNYTIFASSSKNIEIKASKSSATYNDVVYESSQLVKLGGAASFGSGRYISFDVKGACKITVMAKSSSKTDERIINVTDSSKNVVGSIPAPISATFSSIEVSEAGTYSLGSTSGGVYICYIIIEYFE